MVAGLKTTEEIPATPVLGPYILEPQIFEELCREDPRLRV